MKVEDFTFFKRTGDISIGTNEGQFQIGDSPLISVNGVSIEGASRTLRTRALIRRLLDAQNIDIEIESNPGKYTQIQVVRFTCT